MDKLDHKGIIGEPNVTLGPLPSSTSDNPLAEMKFPCCLCSSNLDIKISKKGKPYCTCESCGIQTFFRGKTAISRLKSLLNKSDIVAGNSPGTVQGLILWNKIVQLKAQKIELEEKQGVIIRDPDLANFISTVDNEIKRVQGELRKLSGKSRSEKKV
jgi:hypothetical protein